MIDRLEAHFNRGEWGITKRLAGGIMAADDFSNEEKCRAGILGARACLRLREPFGAVRLAEKALGCAQEAGNEDLEGRATFTLGAVYSFIGDNSVARVHLKTFLDGLHDRWAWLDEEYGAKAHSNMGQVLRKQKLFPDALKHFGQALTRFARAGMVHDEIRAHHDQAWILTLLTEYEEAQEHMDSAASKGELPPDLAEHHVAHEAYLTLKRGDLATASEKAQEILERSSVDPGNRCIALVVAAEVNILCNRPAEAKTLALLAREGALESALPHLMNMVAKILRQLEEIDKGATGV